MENILAKFYSHLNLSFNNTPILHYVDNILFYADPSNSIYTLGKWIENWIQALIKLYSCSSYNNNKHGATSKAKQHTQQHNACAHTRLQGSVELYYQFNYSVSL